MTMDDLEYQLDLSVRYHDKRRGFFERINRVITILTALTSLGAVGILLTKASPQMQAWLTAAVAFFALTELVVQTGHRAHAHMDLRCRYIDMQRTIISAANPNLKELIGQKLLIDADEPAKLRILALIVHNEVVRKRNSGDKHLVKLSFFQRLVAPWFDLFPSKV